MYTHPTMTFFFSQEATHRRRATRAAVEVAWGLAMPLLCAGGASSPLLGAGGGSSRLVGGWWHDEGGIGARRE